MGLELGVSSNTGSAPVRRELAAVRRERLNFGDGQPTYMLLHFIYVVSGTYAVDRLTFATTLEAFIHPLFSLLSLRSRSPLFHSIQIPFGHKRGDVATG
jgi:hypothetical protein